MIGRRVKAVLVGGVICACGLLLSGCWLFPSPPTFEITLAPAAVADLAQNAECHFLLWMTELGTGPSAGPVAIEVESTGEGGMVFVPSELEAGRVAEVVLMATGIPVDTTVTLTIEGRRGDETHSATATAAITPPSTPVVTMPAGPW